MKIQIFIKDNSSTLLNLDSDTYVRDLKNILREKRLVANDNSYSLIYESYFLENNKKLSDYKIGELSTIFLSHKDGHKASCLSYLQCV